MEQITANNVISNSTVSLLELRKNERKAQRGCANLLCYKNRRCTREEEDAGGGGNCSIREINRASVLTVPKYVDDAVCIGSLS